MTDLAKELEIEREQARIIAKMFDDMKALKLAAEASHAALREAVEDCLAFGVHDSRGAEVAEDSLHEIRKMLRAALGAASRRVGAGVGGGVTHG